MSVFKSTIITISVHVENDNPIFGETSTHVSLEDEAGGPYLKLTQCNDNIENGVVKFETIEEFEAVYSAAKMLLNQVETVKEQEIG